MKSPADSSVFESFVSLFLSLGLVWFSLALYLHNLGVGWLTGEEFTCTFLASCSFSSSPGFWQPSTLISLSSAHKTAAFYSSSVLLCHSLENVFREKAGVMWDSLGYSHLSVNFFLFFYIFYSGFVNVFGGRVVWYKRTIMVRNSLTVHYVSFHSFSQTVFPFSAVMGVPNLETSLACCQDGRGGRLTGRGDGGAVCLTASYKVSTSYWASL